MRISFEASSIISKQPTGVAHYIKNFIKSIADLKTGNKIKILYEISRVKYKKDWYKPDSAKTQLYHNSLFPIFKNTDILHGLDGVVPNWKGSRKIVTLLDIFPLINRDSFVSPESFRDKKENVYRRAVSISDLIVTISENTKKDVVEYFQIPESKIVCIYPGVNPDVYTRQRLTAEVREKYGLDRDYLLFVGAVSGRKNTARLVEAFAHSRAGKDFDLVLIGSIAYQGEHTLEAIRKHSVSGSVKLLGYVPEKHKPELYSGATGFLFPTLYEGFGFPILEAMLCGVPVLTSDIGSAPEIGGEFALYVNPESVDSIADGINRLLENSDLDPDSARDHASEFTWGKSAERMQEIYREIYAAGK